MESLFGIDGGQSDPAHRYQRASSIRALLGGAHNESVRRELQNRLGRLTGGTAILRVGAVHETEREARKTMAERAVSAIRSAPTGGGGALLAAQPALIRQSAASE